MIDDDAQLALLELRGEDAYSRMYDARNNTAAAGCYSEAKDFFRDAIARARTLGRTADVDRLEARLAHIKAVFRSQFT
jgi:UDP-3-O-acyl-N-acetylglucosamine deacetylase